MVTLQNRKGNSRIFPTMLSFSTRSEPTSLKSVGAVRDRPYGIE